VGGAHWRHLLSSVAATRAELTRTRSRSIGGWVTRRVGGNSSNGRGSTPPPASAPAPYDARGPRDHLPGGGGGGGGWGWGNGDKPWHPNYDPRHASGPSTMPAHSAGARAESSGSMRPQSRQQQQQEESAGRARSREAETAAALEAELATLRARLGARMAQSEPHVLAALTIQGRCGGVGHVFCRRSLPMTWMHLCATTRVFRCSPASRECVKKTKTATGNGYGCGGR
jgi:hypothetical protein